MDLWSWPPEADREAELQGSDIMPVSDRDEQHFSWLQYTFKIWSLGKLREALCVWIFHLHLHGSSQKLENAAYICRLNMRSLCGLSISPDWYCEGAGIDEGTACLCPRGNIGECICFPPPDGRVPGGKQSAVTWQNFNTSCFHTAVLLLSPEPRSSAEGLGEEETLYLQAQTTRLQ